MTPKEHQASLAEEISQRNFFLSTDEIFSLCAILRAPLASDVLKKFEIPQAQENLDRINKIAGSIKQGDARIDAQRGFVTELLPKTLKTLVDYADNQTEYLRDSRNTEDTKWLLKHFQKLDPKNMRELTGLIEERFQASQKH